MTTQGAKSAKQKPLWKRGGVQRKVALPFNMVRNALPIARMMGSDAAPYAVDGKRLLFSINSGRAGSKYLYRLLDTAANVTATHEPKPSMAGRYVIEYPVSDPGLLDSLFYYGVMCPHKFEKVRHLQQVLADLPANHVYAETTHMFILSFYDVVMAAFGESVSVVIMRRHLPKVVKSMVSLGDFGKRRNWRFWRSSPNARSAAVQAAAPDAELDQMDMAIAYLIDVEARAQRFKQQFPHINTVEVRVEALNDWETVSQVFEQLNLEPSDATHEILGTVVNQRHKKKKEMDQEISEEYCLERIQQYCARCEAQGIQLPDLPQLTPFPEAA